MTAVSRRVLATVLLLVLVLTACGGSSPRVTTEDGRGVERPSGGIWIPETRDVDPGPDPRAVDDPDADVPAVAAEQADGDDPEPDADDRPASRTDRDAAPASPSPTPRRTRSDSGPAPSDDEGDGARQPRSDGSVGADEQEEPDPEPAEPEVVGDCGTTSSSRVDRDRLEASVERLREEIAERWPETQAGAWIVDEPREVRVAFTEEVRSSLRELCRSYEYPHLLRGVRAEVSAAELDEVLETAVEERDALRDGTPPEDLPEAIRRTRGRYDVAVDHAANGLRVTVDRDRDGLLEALRERYTPRLWLDEGWEPEERDAEESERG